MMGHHLSPPSHRVACETENPNVNKREEKGKHSSIRGHAPWTARDKLNIYPGKKRHV